MPLSDVEGQPHAIEALRAALRSGAVHHAWLFTGPEGVGKELGAIGFAQALACGESPGEGCGRCASCDRIARRNHPDVRWVMPEAELVARALAGRSDFSESPSRWIKVDQIRVLEERLSRHPLELARHIGIVAHADSMNEPAQNAFLKTLEEPPPGTVLILVATHPDLLLPTIRSRCTRVQFAPLPEALVARKVVEKKKTSEAAAQLAARMAGGSLARALELDVEMLARRRQLIERFEALDPDDARTHLAFAEELGGSRDAVEQSLHLLDVWTRDVAVVRAGGESIVNRDLTELARAAASKASDTELQQRHQLIGEALLEMTERNASPRLQLEKVLLSGALGVAK
jgi:DNA polymerase III subunit delta'